MARLYGYRRIPRHSPSWPEPAHSPRASSFAADVRDVVVDLGVLEAWTPSLGSDADFDLLHPGGARVRVTNPFAADESVLRATMITGLVRAWAQELRARGRATSSWVSSVSSFAHPELGIDAAPRLGGGAGGTLMFALPTENERLTVVLGRADDDATSAVASWRMLSRRLGLDDVVMRATSEAPRGTAPDEIGGAGRSRVGCATRLRGGSRRRTGRGTSRPPRVRDAWGCSTSTWTRWPIPRSPPEFPTRSKCQADTRARSSTSPSSRRVA